MDVIIIEATESLGKLRKESVLSKPGYRQARVHVAESKEKAKKLLATMDNDVEVRILEDSILKTRDEFNLVMPPRPPAPTPKRPRVRVR